MTDTRAPVPGLERAGGAVDFDGRHVGVGVEAAPLLRVDAISAGAGRLSRVRPPVAATNVAMRPDQSRLCVEGTPRWVKPNVRTFKPNAENLPAGRVTRKEDDGYTAAQPVPSSCLQVSIDQRRLARYSQWLF